MSASCSVTLCCLEISGLLLSTGDPTKKKVHHVLVSNDGLFGSRTNKTHSLEIYGQIPDNKKTGRVRLCQQQLKVLNL